MMNSSKAAKQMVSIIIIILILIAIAAYIGYKSGLSNGMALAAEKEAQIAALNEQIADLNSKIEKVNKAFPLIPELKTLIGTVEEVKGNIIIFNVPAPINPFEQLPEKREATVTAATKLVKQIQKDEFPIELADIKAGDLISVEAANNVKSEIKFEAVKVALLERK